MSIGEKINDKEKAILPLCSMPESKKTMFMSIEKGKDLTYESTESILFAEESRRKSHLAMVLHCQCVVDQ